GGGAGRSGEGPGIGETVAVCVRRRAAVEADELAHEAVLVEAGVGDWQLVRRLVDGNRDGVGVGAAPAVVDGELGGVLANQVRGERWRAGRGVAERGRGAVRAREGPGVAEGVAVRVGGAGAV